MKLRAVIAVVLYMILRGNYPSTMHTTLLPSDYLPTDTPTVSAFPDDTTAVTLPAGTDLRAPGEADTSLSDDDALAPADEDELWTADDFDTATSDGDLVRTTAGEDTAWVASNSGNLVVQAPGPMESLELPLATAQGELNVSLSMLRDDVRLYVTEVVPAEAGSPSDLRDQLGEALTLGGIDPSMASERSFEFKGHPVSEVVFDVSNETDDGRLTCWFIVEDGRTYVLAVFDLDPDSGSVPTARFLESLEITSSRREI